MKKRDRRLDLRRRLASPALAEPARGRQLRARPDQPAHDHGDDYWLGSLIVKGIGF
jgi:hypothetical protein